MMGQATSPAAHAAAAAAPSHDFRTELLSLIPFLRAFARSLCGNQETADDLAQETLVKAWQSRNTFVPGTNLKAWLFTILHNTFRNMRRHDGRNPVEVDSEAVDLAAADIDGSQSPEQILVRGTLDADLQAALDGLPEAFRQAVWLRDVEELSYAEMAKVLDVPIGTVMSRISRGRRALFQALKGSRGTAERRVASR
jgi:RNA polymerase sigma-70 factor (ECF subfamily)